MAVYIWMTNFTTRGLSVFLILLVPAWLSACGSNADSPKPSTTNENMNITAGKTDTAILGAGCFWCIEAIFQELKGVLKVESGYTGGNTLNPTYKEVCTGMTGHAEVARITYNPDIISFEEVLEVFWQTHDPTTLNRQGADVGSQYRSAVFYLNDEQKRLAEGYKQKLDVSGAFDKPIVTEISAFDGKFYVAEDYHQNYYRENPDQGYCRMVIRPKLEKFRKVFSEKLQP
jgi:peptide-methionine (S)-S-oxide reductase